MWNNKLIYKIKITNSNDENKIIILKQTKNHHSDQFSSVAQSCPILCDPMDCNMPVFPILLQL